MLPIEQTLDRLLSFDPGGAHVLTVYLRMDPGAAAGHDPEAALKALLRPLREGLPTSAERRGFDADAEALERLLRTLPQSRWALGLFACTRHDYADAVALPDLVEPVARWAPDLYLRPLLAALDEHERSIVLLLDRRTARFFRRFLGQTEEVATLSDMVADHLDDYTEPDERRKHLAMHVHWHAKRVADTLARLTALDSVDRIVVGGPQEAVSELRRLLPKRLRERVHADLGVAVDASITEVAEAAAREELRIERASELALMAELVERRGQGLGALGASEVASAADAGHVLLLVVAEGFVTPGAECLSCGSLRSDSPAGCQRCGGTMRPLEDLVDRLIGRVVAEGGRVEEVRGAAAQRLTELGGVGAELRFPMAAHAMA